MQGRSQSHQLNNPLIQIQRTQKQMNPSGSANANGHKAGQPNANGSETYQGNQGRDNLLTEGFGSSQNLQPGPTQGISMGQMYGQMQQQQVLAQKNQQKYNVSQPAYISNSMDRRKTSLDDQNQFSNDLAQNRPRNDSEQAQSLQSQLQRQQRRNASQASLKSAQVPLQVQDKQKGDIYQSIQPKMSKQTANIPLQQNQSVTRLQDHKNKKIVPASPIKIQKKLVPPGYTQAQASASLDPTQGPSIFEQTNKLLTRGAHSGDRYAAQQTHSTSGFKSASALNLNPKTKINVKIRQSNFALNNKNTPTSNASGNPMVQTQQPQSRVQSLTQYSNALAKSLDKKSSIKILTNSALVKKSMNQSNPNQNALQEAIKDKKVGSKLQLISNKKYKLQKSPGTADQSKTGDEDQEMPQNGDPNTNPPLAQNAYGTITPPSLDYYKTTKAAVNRSKNNTQLSEANSDSDHLIVTANFSAQNKPAVSKGAEGANSAMGLKNKVKILSNGLMGRQNQGGQSWSAAKVREASKESMKKSQSQLNNSGSRQKFGQPKNSVKPPARKTNMLSLQQQQYNPQLHSGARLKNSRSSLAVANNTGVPLQLKNSIQANPLQNAGANPRLAAQNAAQTDSVYSQLSDRVRRIKGSQLQQNTGQYSKSMSRQASSTLTQTQGAKSKTQAGSQGAHYLSVYNMKQNNQSSSGDMQQKYSSQNSQERVLKMAEEEEDALDDAIAQNYKHNQERQKKKPQNQLQGTIIKMSHAQKNMQALGHKAATMASKAGQKGGSRENGNSSPAGYLSPRNKNTMINLNNVQKVQIVKQSVSKQGRHGPGGMMIPSNQISPNPPQQLASQNFDQVMQFQPMKHNNRQSPIDIPSSSNTSKQSNATHTNSNSMMSSKNQFAPEVRQINYQFNEIVKCLQNIEESSMSTNRLGDDIKSNQMQKGEIGNMGSNPIVPQVSSAIAKLYQVKSAYDQVIHNMQRQVNQVQQLQQHAQQHSIQQTYMNQRQSHQTQSVRAASTNENASQYNKLTSHVNLTPHAKDPPLSTSSRSRGRVDAFIAGTGGSVNRCKHCKGAGQAPSSNSVSDRQTYAGVSARAENTIDPRNHDSQISSSREPARGVSIHKPAQAPNHVTINLPLKQGGPYKNVDEPKTGKISSEKNRQRSQMQIHGDNQRSDSFRQAFSQIQKLTEDNKKIAQLEEKNAALQKQLEEKSKSLVLKEKQFKQNQSEHDQQADELAETKSRVKELNNHIKVLIQREKKDKSQQDQRLLNKAASPSPAVSKATKEVQTLLHLESYLSAKELDLMVELKKQERKLKKTEKEKLYNANKISKFIYFFFTLQNKGIPVNEIYEKDGVKFIKTDRFQEIMGQNNQEDAEGADQGMQSPQDKELDGLSFYSDDSFEYVLVSKDLESRSKFRNLRRLHIPQLEFEGLPEYETTDEEDENEDEEESSTAGANDPADAENQARHQAKYAADAHNFQELEQLGINSPTPHTRLNQYSKSGGNDDAIHISENDIQYGQNAAPEKPQMGSKQKKPMNQKDYQNSMKYIEQFYQKNKADAQEWQQQDDKGSYDDAPKSVTEESSIFEQVATNKFLQHPGGLARGSEDQSKGRAGANMMESLNHNFDQSERFDDSMITPSSKGGVARGRMSNVLGVSIDSQSIDQSLIDQSMQSRKKQIKKIKKQKEDLDGSRLYRDKRRRGRDEDTPEGSVKQSSNGRHKGDKRKQASPSPSHNKKKVKQSPMKNNFIGKSKQQHPGGTDEALMDQPIQRAGPTRPIGSAANNLQSKQSEGQRR